MNSFCVLRHWNIGGKLDGLDKKRSHQKRRDVGLRCVHVSIVNILSSMRVSGCFSLKLCL